MRLWHCLVLGSIVAGLSASEENGVLKTTSDEYIDDRLVTTLPHEDVYIEFLGIGSVIIEVEALTVSKSCHLLTPNNELHTLTEDIDLPGVEIIPSNSTVSCGVNISLLSDEFVGNWTLIAWEVEWINTKLEKRLPITVYNKETSNSEEDLGPVPDYLTLLNISTTLGKSHTIEIESSREQTISCHLITPDKLQNTLGKGFDLPGVEILENDDDSYVACGIIINVISPTMEGEWIFSAMEKHSESHLVEIIQPIHLRIEETERIESNSEEDNKVTSYLAIVHRTTYHEAIMDISLNQIDEEEHCSVIHPDGNIFTFDDLKAYKLPGVSAESSSTYVSCRIKIGPMTEDLLGNWTLTGTYTKGELTYERKYAVYISWHTNPQTAWEEIVQQTGDHVVNLGGTTTPTLIPNFGTFTRQACHVVTPDGTDLLLLTEFSYPNVRQVNTGSLHCTVALGPITADMLGDWSIYGVYGTQSPTIARRTLHLHLYDEENPYNQAYNKTIPDPIDIVVNKLTTIKIEVTGTGSTDHCYVRIPDSSTMYELSENFNHKGITVEDIGSRVGCSISIGPIEDEMLGEWMLIGKFNNRDIFSETQQKYNIILEDPSNPIVDNDREIRLLAESNTDTKLGESHRFTIPVETFQTTESCHIRTPEGLQYILMDGFNIPGVEIIPSNGSISCGVTITLISEELIGNWMLIARLTHLVEMRLPISIHVEEFVSTLPSEETVVADGKDFYIRLEQQTELHSTCKLIAPEGETVSHHEVDDRFVDRCGFVVKKVTAQDSGVWEINYGSKTIYRAQLTLKVIGDSDSIPQGLDFIRDRPVNITVGSDDIIFCRVEDSSGSMVFNGFGACRIVLDRATSQHAGRWRLYTGVPGRILTTEHDLQVTISNRELEPTVATYVSKNSRVAVQLICSLFSVHEISSCKFRDPWGRIMMAAQGLGEDRYTFLGSGISYNDGLYHAECGIEISNATVQDMGIWRCAVDTSEKTYFGFVSVLCPWAMQDPTVAAKVQAEPVARAANAKVEVFSGDSARMLCKVSSAIRYCYFRSENGRTINLSPGTSADQYAYIGEGFDAGECGVLIKEATVEDAGTWTCNVGLNNASQSTQRDIIHLKVTERLSHRQYLNRDMSMVLSGHTNQDMPLEYCRFIRSDGLDFTSDNLPSGYISLESDELGYCGFEVISPSAMDRDRWVIAVKVSGQDEELTVTTDTVNHSPFGYPLYALVCFYILVALLITVFGISICVVLLPPNNRRKTLARVATIRDSFRRSFRKDPFEFNTPYIVKEPVNKNNIISAPSA